MIPLVLASASPRRRALLAALGVSFETAVSHADEIFDGPSPATIVELNACAKRDEIAAQRTRPAVVIGADTLVFLDDHVLGKPANMDEARAMLERLSGRTHQVLTGLAAVNLETGARVQGSETTHVTFRALAPPEIDAFAEAVRPLDRAGAYTVDGPGSLLVARYEGCYQNVLGFPIVRLDQLLREVGVQLFERIDSANAVFL